MYHGYLAIGAGLLRACVIPNKRTNERDACDRRIQLSAADLSDFLSLRRALKYGRYTDPSLKLGVHSMRRYFAAALARESVASAKSVEDGG